MHCKKIHVRIDGRMFSGISNLTGFLMDSSGTEYLQLFRGFLSSIVEYNTIQMLHTIMTAKLSDF